MELVLKFRASLGMLGSRTRHKQLTHGLTATRHPLAAEIDTVPGSRPDVATCRASLAAAALLWSCMAPAGSKTRGCKEKRDFEARAGVEKSRINVFNTVGPPDGGHSRGQWNLPGNCCRVPGRHGLPEQTLSLTWACEGTQGQVRHKM